MVASRNDATPNPYAALEIASEVEEPPKKSQRSGSEGSQRGDRPRQDDVVKHEEAAIRLWQMRQGSEDHPLHSMAIHNPVPEEKSSNESEEEDESEEVERKWKLKKKYVNAARSPSRVSKQI